MKRFEAMLIATVLVSAGCGAAVSGGNAEAGKTQVAGGTTAVTAGPAYDAPATVFTPRSHPPRTRFASVPAPNLASLPALKMRLGECFGIREKEEAAKIAAPSGGGKAQGNAPQAKKAKGGGGGGALGSVGTGGAGYSSGTAQPRAEAKRAPAKAADALAGPSTPAPSPPPAAAPAQAASPAADSSSSFAKSSPAPSEPSAEGNA
jgi:hypothetical protein